MPENEYEYENDTPLLILHRQVLTPPDADRLMREARTSGVLPDTAASTETDRSIARRVCGR